MVILVMGENVDVDIKLIFDNYIGVWLLSELVNFDE